MFDSTDLWILISVKGETKEVICMVQDPYKTINLPQLVTIMKSRYEGKVILL
jgi:D-arabinose 5-phosphate isomerase GutQ